MKLDVYGFRMIYRKEEWSGGFYMEYMQYIGKRVKVLMQLNNETLDDLAEVLQTGSRNLRRYFSGEYCWTVEMIYTISEHYKVDPAAIVSHCISIEDKDELVNMRISLQLDRVMQLLNMELDSTEKNMLKKFLLMVSKKAEEW